MIRRLRLESIDFVSFLEHIKRLWTKRIGIKSICQEGRSKNYNSPLFLSRLIVSILAAASYRSARHLQIRIRPGTQSGRDRFRVCTRARNEVYGSVYEPMSRKRWLLPFGGNCS